MFKKGFISIPSSLTQVILIQYLNVVSVEETPARTDYYVNLDLFQSGTTTNKVVVTPPPTVQCREKQQSPV